MKNRRQVFQRVSLASALLCCAVLMAGCRKKQTTVPVDAPQASAPAVPESTTTTSGIVMVQIPSGEFSMGDATGLDDEKPVHKVQLQGFWMDAYEVTQDSYQKMTGKNPSKFKGLNRPVEQVSWYDAAVLYCNMRSAREGLEPCYDPETGVCDFEKSGYRLPTEAEWEYACRAGATGKYAFGNDDRLLSKYAWYAQNAEKATHPVGRKMPNNWGLYDMHGNVMEWCHDRYSENYYGQSPADNPIGPASGDECVLRGGSWSSSPDACRAAARSSETPRFADACFGSDNYGFRCVKRVPNGLAAR